MKILGVSCGRNMGNSEILLRESLMGAESAGAEVEMIRLNDFDIKPCKGCQACTMKLMKGKENLCYQKDDFLVFREHLLECDAVIFSVPIFLIRPVASFLVMADRIGPFHDVGAFEAMGFNNPDSPLDQRLFKQRAAGFISVGGAVRPQYASMGLTLMNHATYSMHIKVVDQLMVLDSNGAAQVLKHEKKLERAHQLGIHVAQNAGKSEEEMKWCGDFEGTCPVCHGNLLTVDKGDNEVVCAICGIKGKISLNNEKLDVDFPDVSGSRLTKEECAFHYKEIFESLDEYKSLIPMIQEKIKKYKDYDVKIVTP